MTNLLSHSGGKGSSSSSSSSNPFQALAHFYEQEVTDNHIDAHLQSPSGIASSRHFRQQQQQQQQKQQQQYLHNYQVKGHHLFPSSSSSNKDTFVRDNTDTDHGYQSFSNTISSPPHSTLAGHAADISEYLKQRQEYYLREANIRSRDRKDGLGPIIDFSLLSKSRELGHLTTNHYGHAHKDHVLDIYRQREGAATQQEQVWLDISRAESLKNNDAQGWNRLWNQSGTSNSTNAPSGSIASSFLDAAAALPSSWPLAPWAIETQAAIMEFESTYKDYGTQYRSPMAYSQVQDGLPHSTASSWAEEFSKVKTHNIDESAQAKDPKCKTPPFQERRGSVKTCGFMFDTKHQGLLPEESLIASLGAFSTLTSTLPTMEPVSEKLATGYNDDVFEGDMVKAWMETLEQENMVADERIREQAQVPMSAIVPVAVAANDYPVPDTPSETLFEDDMVQAWMNTLEQEMQEADERIQEEEVKATGPVLHPLSAQHKVFNDDVFEGDMTSSWMDVLEQEKREADERMREQEKAKKESVDMVKDKEILDMALRRLNALMHQLDQGQKRRLGLGRTHQTTESMLS
ncbi:hypothetical protein BGZ93_004784 [Podila epicladia]|nr:hypothetical protein BGZ92_000371 [Podila epicladia]KAG0100014.1 hypothetical protein BGZ93_004784 [Podila epicladia]